MSNISSGPEHQEEDWLAIHEKICPIVTVLRAPQSHANSEEERQHRLQQQLLRKVSFMVSLALVYYGFTSAQVISSVSLHSNTLSAWLYKKAEDFCAKGNLG